MNVSVSRLLRGRLSRVMLMIAAILVGVGFALFGGTMAEKLLGLVTGFFLAGLVKGLSELSLETARQDRGASRSARATQVQMQSLLEAIQQQGMALDAAIAEVAEQVARAESRGNQRVEVLRVETTRRLEVLTTSLNDLIAAQKPVRRHVLHDSAHLRELGLRESLDTLSAGDGERAAKNPNQESGMKEPGSGGSISAKG